MIPRREPPRDVGRSFLVVALDGIHGLWGGRAIWCFADGDVWVDNVERGEPSRRYRARSTPQLLDTLEAHLRASTPAPIDSSPLLPDQHVPRIEVTTTRGTTLIARGAVDELLRTCADELIATHTPIWEGRGTLGRPY